MRHALRAILVGGLGFAVAVIVAACGSSSGLLSSDQANTLNDSLSAVASAIDQSHCAKAGSAAQDFADRVTQISPSLKPALADNLKEASQALNAQAQPGCESGQTKSIPTTTKPTPTTSTPTQATTETTPSTPTAPSNTGAGQSTTSATTQSTPGTTTTTGGAGLGGGTATTSTGGSGGAAPGTGNGT